MNAKEGNNRPGALGRGLDTLMGNEEERGAAETASLPETEAAAQSGKADGEPCRQRALEQHACLIGGLIASGAAGAVVVATFSLLGVKAVLAMARHR